MDKHIVKDIQILKLNILGCNTVPAAAPRQLVVTPRQRPPSLRGVRHHSSSCVVATHRLQLASSE
jgi:hypothetical protein